MEQNWTGVKIIPKSRPPGQTPQWPHHLHPPTRWPHQGSYERPHTRPEPLLPPGAPPRHHPQEPRPGPLSYAQVVRRAADPPPTLPTSNPTPTPPDNQLRDIQHMLSLLCSHLIGQTQQTTLEYLLIHFILLLLFNHFIFFKLLLYIIVHIYLFIYSSMLKAYNIIRSKLLMSKMF